MNIKRVLILILAIVLIVVALIAINRPWTFIMDYETTNSNDYKKCLELVDDLYGVKEIFPKEVPSDVKDADFDCYNNLGGKFFKLSCSVTSADIKEYMGKAVAIAVCYGGKDNLQVKKALPEFKLTDLKDDDLVYVLNSAPYKENDFNHAEIVFIILNESSGYISFNAEAY